jgi:hypothetical protein
MAKPRDNTPIDPRSLTDFTMVLDKFAAAVGSTLEMAGREQIRLMCRDAMTFTPPMPKGGGRGLIDAARRAGANKLGNDVRRIFIAQDDPVKGRPVFLRKIINAVRTRDSSSFLQLHQDVTESKIKALSPVMRAIMEDANWQRAQAKARNYLNKTVVRENLRASKNFTRDLRPIHDQAKGAVGGRWPKSNRYRGPQYLVDSTSALNAYIQDRQTKVGRVKAGWAALLRQVPKPVNKKGVEKNYGTYNAPWVDANIRSAQGVFSQSITRSRVSMTIQNLIGNINNVAKGANTENIVYGNRIKQMRSAVLQRFGVDIDEANKGKK